MKLDGSYMMDASRERVYATLADPEALRSCLPGCEKFEEVSPGRYETTLKAGLAGIKGAFIGAVTMSDQQPPESYTLAVEGTFSGGFVKGAGHITLTDDEGKTKVAYSGDGQLGGPLASVGQRLIVPATKMIVGQFFRCMAGQIKQEAEAVGQAGE